MKLFGTTSPWVFRVYIMLYGVLGLYFLMKMLAGRTFQNSMFIVVFALTSPVYLSYINGFLPTIPSMANVFIAYYFYFQYLKELKIKYFIFSVIFFALASLNRTPFAIFFIAMMSYEFLLGLLKRKISLVKVGISVLGVSTIVAYFFYNQYLRSIYGSVFLANIAKADSFQEFFNVAFYALKYWGFHYFTISHYVFILILSVFFFKSGSKIIELLKANNLEKALFAQGFISLTGAVMYYILMIRQYRDHDYYFLDSLFVPIILLSGFFIQLFKNFKYRDALFIIFVVFSLFFNYRIQNYRRQTGPWDKYGLSVQNFENAEEFLDEMRVPKDAKIVVFNAQTPNIPFIRMNRNGMSVMYDDDVNLHKQALKWDFDYVIIQNNFYFDKLKTTFPEVTTHFKKIGSNGNLTLCVRDSLQKPKTDLEFFKSKNTIPLLNVKNDFESKNPNTGNWKNIHKLSKKHHTGKYSSEVFKEEFSNDFNLFNNKLFTTDFHIIDYSFWFHSDQTPHDLHLIFTADSDGRQIIYTGYSLTDLLKDTTEWQYVSIRTIIPKFVEKEHKFAIYFWNKGKNHFFVDDISIKIY